jgi:hypothetical protein
VLKVADDEFATIVEACLPFPARAIIADLREDRGVAGSKRTSLLADQSQSRRPDLLAAEGQ